MDEDIAIVNRNTKLYQIKNFFKNNSKRIFVTLSICLIILISFFLFEELKKRKKNKLAEIYNNTIFNNNNYSQEEIKSRMLEIINGKVETYSTLALYHLIDNDLIKDEEKINDLFNVIISINKDIELRNLIIFKKALYFSDKLPENELLKIINPIINSDSIWRQHALLLMGDFYFYNKNFNKSKEFFQKIIELKNVNPKIKLNVEKRLNRDFSE
tara:strand:- start:963 stop:1604 length:642 start_codon:yes stop_codon:yes gene_type:complete